MGGLRASGNERLPGERLKEMRERLQADCRSRLTGVKRRWVSTGQGGQPMRERREEDAGEQGYSINARTAP